MVNGFTKSTCVGREIITVSLCKVQKLKKLVLAINVQMENIVSKNQCKTQRPKQYEKQD